MSSSQDWSFSNKQTRLTEQRVADIKQNIQEISPLHIAAAFSAYTSLRVLSYKIALTNDQRSELDSVINSLKPIFTETMQ